MGGKGPKATRPQKGSSGQERPTIKVLEKAIRILELFSPGKERLSLDQISLETGLPKPTAFRIVKTLERAGFLAYDPEVSSYSLGLKLLELGGLVYESLSLRKAASPEMNRLSERLKATVLLGIIREDHLLYIDKRETHSLIKVSSYMGLKRPPHYGMLGTVLLAFMDPEERARLLKAYPPQKITTASPIDQEEILSRLNKVRELGYFMERGEVIEGVVGIGAPVRDFSGDVVAALGVALMEFQLRELGEEQVIGELLISANEVSKALGYGLRKE